MKNRRAVTLIELSIAFFLLTIMAGPLYFLLQDTTKKSNIAVARDAIKQEANQIYRLLENDLTQAAKPSEEELEKGVKSITYPDDKTVLIKVRVPDKRDQVKLADLKYIFNKPVLKREFEGKTWQVSKQVSNFEVSPSLDGSKGKYVVGLFMKSNYVGLKDEEQPTYEQEKIIICMEEATEKNDPFWRKAGEIGRFFSMQGNLLAGLKEDTSKMVQDFKDTWTNAFDDIKDGTIDELKNSFAGLKDNLASVKTNLDDMNSQISELDWHALFDESSWSPFDESDKSRKRRAENIRNELVSYKSKEDMNWDRIKALGGSNLKEEAAKSFYDAKEELFNGRNQILDSMKMIEEHTGQDLGFSSLDSSLIK